MGRPIPAVVEGHAVAGGFTLAMGCDFVVSEVGAVFGAFEMRNGFPAAVNTPLLAKLVTPRIALEWALLGEPISAVQALDWGLINRLASKGKAVETAMELAGELAQRPNVALRACKKAIDQSFVLAEDAAIEEVLSLMERTFATNDGREGVRAFFAKEDPKFEHS